MANETVNVNDEVLQQSVETPGAVSEITSVKTTLTDFTVKTPSTPGSEKTLVLGTPVWDDLRFPFEGRRLDSSSTRYRFDQFNGGVVFDSDARYTQEPISMMAQLQHTWLEGSEVRAHMHWLQTTANAPNWLLAYKILENNALTTLETDYSNHTLVAGSQEFTYVSGNLVQITDFNGITMTGKNISDMIHCVLFRDSANASGLFVGNDPSSADEVAYEFDIHYQIDTQGSRQEYIK